MPDGFETSSRESTKPTLLGHARTEWNSLQRRTRSALTQDSVIGGLKTLAWVVPLTLLIWVYAEREQLWREPGVAIPIRIGTADPTRLVKLIRPTENLIHADLEGPRAEVDSIRNEFARVGGMDELEILIDRLQLPPGRHELRTATLIGDHPMFRPRGIAVTNCQPVTLQIFVDHYEDVSVEVQAPESVTNLAAPPVFEPATVRVRAPRDDLEQAKPLAVLADLSALANISEPGTHELPTVRLVASGLEGPHVSISPPTVKATLQVRQADEHHILPFMAVNTIIPAAIQKQYRVDAPDTITNVTVIGPPDKIALLKQPGYQPWPIATLKIEGDDRPAEGQAVGPVRTRRLSYLSLPEGVKVAPEELQRTVDFKLIERTAEP